MTCRTQSKAELDYLPMIFNLTIDSQDDALKLQQDLKNLEQWENQWSMAFNTDKCEIIRITKKKKNN